MDNIKVAVRVRPMNSNEIRDNSIDIIRVDGQCVTVSDPITDSTRDFIFDYVFPITTNNRTIFETLGESIVESAQQGYNCCVLAYGQTGSGKTHTMLNYNLQANTDLGLIPNICNALISNVKPNCEIHMEVSFVEIYAEKIYDLLSPNSGRTRDLKLRINPKIGTFIQDLTTVAVSNTNEIMKLIEQGFRHRSVSSTAMNEQSSRSHAIFTINFKQLFHADSKLISSKSSKINLVDLAGSERVKTSKVQGTGFQEAIAINKSLSMLSAVFNDLVETGSSNKFRNSVLTSLLADSISGLSKTVIIANISSSSLQYEITMQSLFYVVRTKKIAIRAVVNEVKGDTLIDEKNLLKQEVDRLKEELAQAQKQNNQEMETKLKLELQDFERKYHESSLSWSEKLQESFETIKLLESIVRQSKDQTELNIASKLNTDAELLEAKNKISILMDELQSKEQSIIATRNKIKKLIDIFGI